MRLATLTIGLLLMEAAALGTAQAAPVPPQGMYDTCVPGRSEDRCAYRLQRLADAGFQVVQNMAAFADGAADRDILAYADAAEAAGITVIWPLNAFADDPARAAQLVSLVRGHPATWGYYVADEPAPLDHDRVKAFSERVRKLDPDHPRLIMGCGNCFGGEASVSFLADIDAALGTDLYPVLEQGPDQPLVSQRVAEGAAGLRRVADRAGRRAVVALQAWRWGDSHFDSIATGIAPERSRFPTRREIRMQRNAAITHGRPDLILWFTLNQVIGWERGQSVWYWARPADPEQRWDNLVRGAFSAPPTNRRPVALFELRQRRRGSTLRVTVDGTRSYDPDGRIVRYRWYIVDRADRSRRVGSCRRPKCRLLLTRARGQSIRLVVTDSQGVRVSRRVRVGAR